MHAEGNLGDAQQNKRLRMSVGLFAATLVLAISLLELHVGRGYLALLFIPFLLAANGFYQGLYRTCTFMAAKGLRDGEGEAPEQILNPAERAKVRRRGMRTVLDAVVTAAVLTVLVLLVG